MIKILPALLRKQSRWTHRKDIVPRLRQKGVEIDPFKVGVVQFLPKAEKGDCRAASHSVLDDIFWLDRILQCGNVGDANIIGAIVANHEHNRAVDVQLIVALHLHGLIFPLFDFCTNNSCENYSISYRATQVPRGSLTGFRGRV